MAILDCLVPPEAPLPVVCRCAIHKDKIVRMTATRMPIAKAWRISATRVGHSPVISDKFFMGFSPMLLLEIVPGWGLRVCDGGHTGEMRSARASFVTTITV